MTKTVQVSGHIRKIEKSPEYISTNVALMTDPRDQKAFLERHNIKTVSVDDRRLAAPIPAPANGSARYSKSEIEEQAIGLAQIHGVV